MEWVCDIYVPVPWTKVSTRSLSYDLQKTEQNTWLQGQFILNQGQPYSLVAKQVLFGNIFLKKQIYLLVYNLNLQNG